MGRSYEDLVGEAIHATLDARRSWHKAKVDFSGGARPPGVSLTRMRTLYADPQATEDGRRTIEAFLGPLRASGRVEIVEDEDAADARLRLTISSRGDASFEIISGQRAI
jgi:hypothetical protein